MFEEVYRKRAWGNENGLFVFIVDIPPPPLSYFLGTEVTRCEFDRDDETKLQMSVYTNEIAHRIESVFRDRTRFSDTFIKGKPLIHHNFSMNENFIGM